MREILSRGKRVNNGEWVEGYLAEATVCTVYDTYLSIVIYKKPQSIYDSEWYEVIPGTVGQYTGLKDRNGKKIFEGDILKTIVGCIFSVEWEKEGRFLGFTSERKIVYVNREPKAEVIGNIHDNPELLEVN